MKFRTQIQLTNLITRVKFLVDRFSGYGVLSLTPAKLPFPIDLLRRSYTTVYALPSDTVITV